MVWDRKQTFSCVSVLSMLRNRFRAQGSPRICGSRDSVKLYRSIDLTTGFLIAMLNIIEIIMITKIKRKKRIYEIILASLSISDCMFGLSNVIVSSFYLSNSCKYRNLLETAYVSYAFFVLTSIFHLIFIAVDRVMIVLKPFQYETIFTTKRLKIGIAVLWLIAFVIGVITYTAYVLNEMEPTVRDRLNSSVSLNRTTKSIGNSGTRSKKQRFQNDMQLVLSIVIATMDLLMVLCYCTIIYQMSFKNRTKLKTKSPEDERLPILCVVIATVFVVFTLPYAVARFCLGKTPFWARFILLLNSGVNSIVYFFRRKFETYQMKKNESYQSNSMDTIV